MLSLLITTRGRTQSLNRLMDSVINLASDTNNIEVIFGIDSDDDKTKKIVEQYSDLPKTQVLVNQIKKEEYCIKCQAYHINRHKRILNPMARMARGKYLWGLNDDVEIKTDEYDLEISSFIEDFLKDKTSRIFYGRTNETFRIRNRGLRQKYDFQFDFACYPIMTEETIKCLGWFAPEGIYASSADITIANIFHSSICDRFRVINNVTVFDYIENPPDNSLKSTPPCIYKDTPEDDLINGINKLNKEFNDMPEVLELKFFYIKLTYHCKACGCNIFLGSNSKSHAVTCGECGTINYLPQEHLNTAASLKNQERIWTGQINGF